VVRESNTQKRDDIVTRIMTSDSRRFFGILGATAVGALALATLLPTKWIPRTGHWEVEHFIAYFVTTMILSIASRRPIIVAGSLIMFAGILEALQGLTPDRFPDFNSALCGSAGVISAATLAMLLLRVRRAANVPQSDPSDFHHSVARVAQSPSNLHAIEP
jgi:hypothetical protein